MARMKNTDGWLKVWLSPSDTYNWATRPGNSWPCSQLRGIAVFAEFDPRGDLVDMRLRGGKGNQDCDATEFNACMNDHIRARFPAHPAIR